MTCKHIPITDDDVGEIICKKCGQVIEERMTIQDEGLHTAEDSTAASKSRMAPHIGVSTKMDMTTVDKKNKQLYTRLEMWESRKVSQRDRGRYTVITAACSRLNLPPHVQREVIDLYNKCTRKGLSRGRALRHLAGGCIRHICKQRGINKPMIEIAASCNMKVREIFAILKILNKEFESTMVISTPEEYLGAIVSALEFEEAEIRKCRLILRAIEESNLAAGRHPTIVVAGVCYLVDSVSRRQFSQERIAKLAKTTAVSIRTFTKFLRTNNTLGPIVQRYLLDTKNTSETDGTSKPMIK